jgi:hypothetical protein
LLWKAIVLLSDLLNQIIYYLFSATAKTGLRFELLDYWMRKSVISAQNLIYDVMIGLIWKSKHCVPTTNSTIRVMQ